MTSHHPALSVALVACLMATQPALAAPTPAPAVQSAHLNGHTIQYRAQLDETILLGAKGQPESRIVTPSYIRVGVQERTPRPIIFGFNGGPGSSSSFLHLGMLGPRRLNLPADVRTPLNPPYSLVENADSPLDVADVVLIDPVGTGYSRLLDTSALTAYYSVDGDGEYLARLIARWLADHGRGDAPVYIMGESYGAMRSVAIARHLTGEHPTVDLRGVIMLSESIGALETVQRRTNIVGRAAALPTLAAIAYYHHKTPASGEDLQTFLGRVRSFAETDYISALYRGRDLPPDRRAAVADQLAKFTGLTAQQWVDNDLMITKEEFRRLLLAGDGLVTGRYDGRYVGPISGPEPSLAGMFEANAWGVGTLIKDVFHDGRDEPYRNQDLPEPTRWTYSPFSISPTSGEDFRVVDYPQELLQVMQKRPKLRIFIAGGYYDTTATIGTDEYLLRRTAFPRERVQMRHYEGGHMFYTVDASRAAFGRDVRAFVTTEP